MMTDPNDLARRIFEALEKPEFSNRRRFYLPPLTPEQEAIIDRFNATRHARTDEECLENQRLLWQIHSFQPAWHMRTLDPHGVEVDVYTMTPNGASEPWLNLTYEYDQWWQHDGTPYFEGWK